MFVLSLGRVLSPSQLSFIKFHYEPFTTKFSVNFIVKSKLNFIVNFHLILPTLKGC